MELNDKNHKKLVVKLGRPLASEWLKRIAKAQAGDDSRLEELLMMTVNGLPDLKGSENFSDTITDLKDKEGVNKFFGTSDPIPGKRMEFGDEAGQREAELNAANAWFGVSRIGK